MTVQQTSLLLVGIIIAVLIAIPVVASIIRDRDYKRQIAGKKPMRKFRENFRRPEETQSTESGLLSKFEMDRYKMDIQTKQNILHATNGIIK